jgi:hypothetical protein
MQWHLKRSCGECWRQQIEFNFIIILHQTQGGRDGLGLWHSWKRPKKGMFTDIFSVRNHEGQRPIGRHRCGYDDPTRIDFTGIGYSIPD